jgi:hypothetical protein
MIPEESALEAELKEAITRIKVKYEELLKACPPEEEAGLRRAMNRELRRARLNGILKRALRSRISILR